MAEPAPAKLNLWLHVTGRRADGYHELDSLVAFASVGDRLSLDPDAPLSLTLTGPFAGALSGDNLVLAAARALARQAGRPERGAFVLEKNLPVASGIGGGSADAAAALRLLARAWGIDPADPALAALALSLGADVPVCLAGRTLRMSGIGERLEPGTTLTGTAVLLANPGRPVSTAAVFRARSGPYSEPPGSMPPLSAASLAEALRATRNDLEAPAVALEPAVGRTLERLGRLAGCRLARMSGSGATCFALFDDRPAAEAAAAALSAVEPGWWVAAATLL